MQLKKLSGTRLRILVSLYSSAFILADSSKSIFDHIIAKMDNISNSRISRMSLNQIVGTRFDTLVIVTFLEFIYPMRFAVFMIG